MGKLNLIDADKLVERINLDPYASELSKLFAQYHIYNATIIDAEPVVRCRDCMWWGKLGCAVRCESPTDTPEADDFCSFGERRGKKCK